MKTSQCLSYRSLEERRGRLGGLPKKQRDQEEKKEDDDEEKEIEGKRKDQEEMQDSLVLEEGMMVNLSLFPLPLVFFPCSSCYKAFFSKKNNNNQIVELHKDPTSCIICYDTFLRRTFQSGTGCALPLIIHLQHLQKKTFGRGQEAMELAITLKYGNTDTWPS